MVRLMMHKVREFLRSSAGKITAAVLTLVAIVLLISSIRSNLGASDVATLSRSRIYICSETGKTFNYDVMKYGSKMPVKSPYTGRETAYPAELCYWTKDGKVKKDPTYVLLKQYTGV